MAKWLTKIEKIIPNSIFESIVLPKAFIKRCKETRFIQEWKMPLWQLECLNLGWDGEGDPTQWMIQKSINFKGPKYQRGSLSGIGVIRSVYAGGGGSVVMSGEANAQFNASGVCQAGMSFNSDGTITEIGPDLATIVQVDPGEWWSNEPETGIGSSYDVRALSTGASGSWGVAAASNDTWIDMSSSRQWRVTVIAKNAPDIASASNTFEIRTTGTGSALDSAFYSCVAEN